jgi:hypothetical protein
MSMPGVEASESELRERLTAAFIDIISEGQGDIGGVMQPLPEGL